MAGCRMADPRGAPIIVQNSSTTQPPQNHAVKEADKPHTTQTLLMRAGDVESNPGPKCKHKSNSEKKEDFDDILKKVAQLTGDNMAIDDLGKALGFDPTDIGRYITTNTRGQHVTYEGTLKMLRDWRNNQRKAEDRSVLGEVFREIKREDLAELLITSDDLPQNDLLESVVKDIKEYYTRNMCIIQADPTNNDVMFEFNHIYTDPTLSEEDRNDKTKKPLLFGNLLKTKINGLSPNRLLVQAEGGAGKTTFCSKIAWDWAHDLGFKQFKLVAVIPLRKAKNKTVGEVIKSYLPDNNPFTAAQIDEYILSNEKDVFLVFDGLDELGGKFSDSYQVVQIILNRLFMSGTVLVTSRQWRRHEICSSTELKKVYAFIYIGGFSVDNVAAYITKFFQSDAASSQELIDFITTNDVIVENMARFPIYINMLCIMWREYDGERQEAMSKLTTFSQLFDEMFDILVDHCGSKDDSQTGPTVQELRKMIPDHLKVIGEIAFQGILDRRLEFSEDAFQNCRKSMDMGFKVGILTREKHATPRRDRRKNPLLEMSMVQFPHQLFQEFMAAKYVASLHSSDHNEYEGIMANILKNVERFRYLLYFMSAQGEELGLDIVTRLIILEAKDYIILDEAYESNNEVYQLMAICKLLQSSSGGFALPVAQEANYDIIPDDASKSKFDLLTNKELSVHMRSCASFGNNASGVIPSLFQEEKEHYIVDVAYESRHKSVAEKVGNQLMRSRKTLAITFRYSAHTLSGMLFIKDHLGEVNSLFLERPCGRIASQDLAEFILSSTSLRAMGIGSPMHAVFYSILADKVQTCQIRNLKIYMTDLRDQPLQSRNLAEFLCQMPHLESLELSYTIPHEYFFLKWASIVSSAKSTAPHTSLRELISEHCIVSEWQACGDMFNSVKKLSICFSRDFECGFIERIHGFQGVTELSILGRVWTKSCRVTCEPGTMIKHLVRVFPQLIKMTFRIHLSNAVLIQILESLRETRGLPLKSVRVLKCATEDGLDELLLSTLINRINDENVFRVDVEPILRDETALEQYDRQRCKLDSNEGSNDDDESGDKSDDDDESSDKSDADDESDDKSKHDDESSDKSDDDDESGDRPNDDDESGNRPNDDDESGDELDNDFIMSCLLNFCVGYVVFGLVDESGDGLDESGDGLDDESGDGLDDESGDELDDESGDELDDESGDELDDESGDELDDESGDELDDESGDELDDESGDELDDESGDELDDESGDELDDESGDELDDESGDELDYESSDGLDDESQRAHSDSDDKYE